MHDKTCTNKQNRRQNMKKLFLLAIAAILCTIASTFAATKTLWLIGDATMAHYTDSTLAYGWGTAFEQYVNNKVSLLQGLVTFPEIYEMNTRKQKDGNHLTSIHCRVKRLCLP